MSVLSKQLVKYVQCILQHSYKTTWDGGGRDQISQTCLHTTRGCHVYTAVHNTVNTVTPASVLQIGKI